MRRLARTTRKCTTLSMYIVHVSRPQLLQSLICPAGVDAIVRMYLLEAEEGKFKKNGLVLRK